jgi:DNA-binding NtrC family response regulator
MASTKEPTSARPPHDAFTVERRRPLDESRAYGVLVAWPGGVVVQDLPSDRSLTIGRGAECDIVVVDESVSRRHARLNPGSPPTIEDLGSRNGTYVGGQRIPAELPVAVAPGTVVEVGAATVVVQLGGSGAARETLGVVPQPSQTQGKAVIADAAMKRLYGLLDVIAPADISVLILGETGVGKEVLAETIHARSQRVDAPYLRINCASLPETLLESELFGHEKGAFTGAVAAKAGLLESADGGTVFLDEIGEISLATQAKLLRVLENGEVLRLGSLKPKRIRVRVLSATNRDLPERIREGAFRSDLFFRLNGVTLTIPALRHRPDDIVPLAEQFLKDLSRKEGRPAPKLSAAAKAALVAYSWPGNVRELRNRMERALLMARGSTLEAEHLLAFEDPSMAKLAASGPSESLGAPLPVDVTATREMPPRGDVDPLRTLPHARPADGAKAEGGGMASELRDQMQSFERQRIIEALEKCLWNQTRAAKVLGVSRRTLINKLDLYGIARPRKGREDDDEG